MLESMHKSLDCSIYDLLKQDVSLQKNLLSTLEASGQDLDDFARIQLQEIRALLAITTVRDNKLFVGRIIGATGVCCSAGSIVVACKAGAIRSFISFLNGASIGVSAFAMCGLVSLNGSSASYSLWRRRANPQ